VRNERGGEGDRGEVVVGGGGARAMKGSYTDALGVGDGHNELR